MKKKKIFVCFVFLMNSVKAVKCDTSVEFNAGALARMRAGVSGSLV